jgi:hypothetical protein
LSVLQRHATTEVITCHQTISISTPFPQIHILGNISLSEAKVTADVLQA